MSFEEWWNTKDYPARCKGNCKEAYEAGMKADVHTDNSAVIAKLETQIEKMKCCTNCKYYSMRFLPYFCTKNGTSPHCTSNCDKWEIKEK